MSKIILKKNSTDYPLLTMPNHYPADRVYLDGDTTKTVQDAVDKSQAMIATVQPNLTAVKAYAKGEQFVYNGLLYKTTAAISSGGTITIGGNCELSPKITEQYRIKFKDVNGTTGTTGVIVANLAYPDYTILYAVIPNEGYAVIPKVYSTSWQLLVVNNSTTNITPLANQAVQIKVAYI